MKQKITLLIIFILILPTKTNALEYTCTLSGNDKINSKSNDSNINLRSITPLNINISNINNISSFTVYIQYDNELIGVNTCNLLNYIGSGCSTTSDRKIFYEYKYSDTYLNLFDKYNLYTVSFMPKASTPESGKSEVKVYFENAKDIEGNSITINNCNKTYNFSKPGMIFKKKY